jgi:O-acetylhomoserine (thiol)-lyase
MKYTTKALHTKYPKSDIYGSLRVPIYQNAAFEYETAQELEDVFTGKKAGHTYSRASNPTVEELENKVKHITSSQGVVATSSGMAAISNTFFALLKSGDNIITTNKLFGHTLSFFQNTLVDFGIDVRYVDITSQDCVKKLSQIAKKHHIVLIADTTMTPFYLFDSKKYGIDIDLLSATKYISGGGTVVGGLIIDNGTFEWSKYPHLNKFYDKFGQNAFIAKLKKQTFRNIGSSLSPQSAYMLSLGLETLALRADRTNENIRELSYFLYEHKKVKSVNYPLLKDNPYYELAKEYFLFPGSILTFDLEDKAQAYALMDRLKLVRRSTNIQDNKSLIIAPYHTIYSEYSTEQKQSFGLREGTLRLSVGIEDISDLIEDLNNALKEI